MTSMVFSRQGRGEGGGFVFVADVQPTGTGNVLNKVYATADNFQLLTAETDTLNVTVHVIADTGTDAYEPTVTVNGVEAELSRDTRGEWVGTAEITLTDGSITLTHSDGSTHLLALTVVAAPVVQSATWGAYPNGPTAVQQTELANDDVMTLTVTGDVAIAALETDSGYTAGATSATNNTAFGATNTVESFTVTIDRATNAVESRPVRVRMQNAAGAWSDWFTTDDLTTNNTTPSVESFSQSDVTYPGGQQALKDSEGASVHLTVSNWSAGAGDVISYSSSELDIANASTYEASKSVTLNAAGRAQGYRVSGTNYSITATKISNGRQGTRNGTVYIAHDAPVITLSHPTRLRSGGNDGTSAQNHTITLTSDQNLNSTPAISLSADIGTWQGSWSGSGGSYTRSLQVHDNDAKGTGTFSGLTATNLAGKVQTVISAGASYTVGGFVQRQVTFAAQSRTVQINVGVADTSKLTATNNARALPATYEGVKRDDGFTAGVEAFYTLVDAGEAVIAAFPSDETATYIYNNDKAGSDSNFDGTALFTIEETA